MTEPKQPTMAEGKICYIEIPARDIDASVNFYREVFGWRTRTRGDGHVAFDDTVGAVSGTWVLKRKPTTEAGLLIYIMVDSVAATIEKVTAKGGGEIVQPIGADAPEITARFAAPAGNILGLYQHRG
ncbi:MAG: VOC family protein [Pyrinomonadaceae bacterium]